jgi:hypothetical protein
VYKVGIKEKEMPENQATTQEISQEMKAKAAQYSEAVKAAKEEVLTALASVKTATAFITEVQNETQGDFPYTWDFEEAGRILTRLVQTLDVDIQTFEKLAGQTQQPPQDQPAVPTPVQNV